MPIEIKNLSHTYMKGTTGERTALKAVSLTINEGEFWGIIGHTGSDKSTLLQHIGGIMPPEEGSVIVDGYDFADK
ncbi:MAG: ATP-binding cassette domain-containing protein, partial [Clostridia bacterium]|nr:ATP-binding cassette domain-containing protein [Clostridia bacterium]